MIIILNSVYQVFVKNAKILEMAYELNIYAVSKVGLKIIQGNEVVYA
jgi:hypothetical protein